MLTRENIKFAGATLGFVICATLVIVMAFGLANRLSVAHLIATAVV
ncbi:MAG: hypothetical protein JKY49_03495 [Cohaesibacteraceae bacterium]|nr:hypothetical protein [Cohaesibacteraceae bacterium]MBL4876163.1 hypothetical protein [Cohaesibacteraceae bacterium]